MLPTPDTSHVPYSLVYEPAEDSFLLLDTLSSPSETAFLSSHFSCPPHSPRSSISSPSWDQITPALLVLEVGSGSGVVTAFLTANAGRLFGTTGILTLNTDVNLFACKATARTTKKACDNLSLAPGRKGTSDTTTEKDEDEKEKTPGAGEYLASLRADLTSPLLPGSVDVLVFNPPYVPTSAAPQRIEERPQGGRLKTDGQDKGKEEEEEGKPSYEEESYLLELSYAGGEKGMEVTNRLLDSLPEVLSPRGCAYVLLCAQNKPEEVKMRIRDWDAGGGRKWMVETVGSSGKKAGWEKLQIVRIWRTQFGVGDNNAV